MVLPRLCGASDTPPQVEARLCLYHTGRHVSPPSPMLSGLLRWRQRCLLRGTEQRAEAAGDHALEGLEGRREVLRRTLQDAAALLTLRIIDDKVRLPVLVGLGH